MAKDFSALAKAISIPSGYAKFRLGLNLHPIQAEVIDNLFAKDKNKVSFRACNESGKTSICITVAILYAIEMRNAMVVSTSATFRQITKQLIPNLKAHAHNYTNWQFLDNSIKVNNETRYIGFSTSEDSKFQGYHETPDRPLLIIVDEAAGVADDIFQSIGRCNPTWLLIAGSPLGPEGVFYSIEHNVEMYKQFIHYKITKYEITKEKGWWLEKKDIDSFVEMWGTTHPLVQSSVYAEFASNIENGLISLPELEKCYKYPPVSYLQGMKHVGLDFAAGGDNNVISLCIGNTVEIIRTWKERDTMNACETFAVELNKLKDKYNISSAMVSGDADGLGIGMIHRLKDLGWKINEFHGGSAADDGTYKNRIAQAWMEGIKKIKACSVIIPNDNEFKMQILSRKQVLTPSGKLQLESKAEMRARGVNSPDIADSIFMAMSSPNTAGQTSFIKPIMMAPKQYSYF